jgi:hypothetical protein
MLQPFLHYKYSAFIRLSQPNLQKLLALTAHKLVLCKRLPPYLLHDTPFAARFIPRWPYAFQE